MYVDSTRKNESINTPYTLEKPSTRTNVYSCILQLDPYSYCCRKRVPLLETVVKKKKKNDSSLRLKNWSQQ